jgi:hypothetical protein
MNFSAWSIRNPVAPLLAFFLLLILGWQSFNALPITRFPNIDVPLVAVSVAQSGAAPAEMESQVTKEIEDAVAGLTGAKRVTSTVTDGLSTTVIEFRMEVPTDKAVQDVKDAVDQIRGDLPGGIESPIVTRIDVEGQAIMTFAVHAPDMTMEEISWFVDDTVTRALQGKPGIGRVTRIGGADREIRVELDPVKLDSYGVTAQAISAQIAATNTNLGAGKVKLGTGEQVIRTLGDQGTVDSLANTTIALPSGRFVKLTDLGQVIDSYEELKSFARIDGEASVSFLVFRSKGASEVSVAEVTNQVVEELRQQNPNVSITMVDDSVFYTYGNYECAPYAPRRRASGDPRRPRLPQELARHADFRRGPSPLGDPDLLAHVAARLLAEPRQLPGPDARHRHPRRRRHRGNREHRPPHPHGENPLPRGDRGRGRDRPGRHRHHLDHHRGLRPRVVHARHPRPVLPPVRPDRGHRRLLLASRRAPDHPDDGGLFHARQGCGRS